ncbi:hypothetical protein CDD81_1958 [Ophiocordyceps australis]|uniref:Uncharacterized protein n=1 Tax=Ophiocordyceps australis TaxID=1399860 RepID=A0A2C5XXR6_9HYPO|nr:hypothetical protein CDD81_1958 [Ophiocordyceps australis]
MLAQSSDSEALDRLVRQLGRQQEPMHEELCVIAGSAFPPPSPRRIILEATPLERTDETSSSTNQKPMKSPWVKTSRDRQAARVDMANSSIPSFSSAVCGTTKTAACKVSLMSCRSNSKQYLLAAGSSVGCKVQGGASLKAPTCSQ